MTFYNSNTYQVKKPININSFFPDPYPVFYAEKFTKKFIVIHHTVSSGKAYSALNSWYSRYNCKGYPISTAYIIEDDGTVVEVFNPEFWSHHVGSRKSYNPDKYSIGIELCNWGPAGKKDNKFKVFFDVRIKDWKVKYSGNITDYVSENGNTFRGNRYYASYTDDQIASLEELLIFLTTQFNISKDYVPLNASSFNNVIASAERGNINGILVHTNLRRDKSDAHPQPELIEMLKRVKNQ